MTTGIRRLTPGMEAKDYCFKKKEYIMEKYDNKIYPKKNEEINPDFAIELCKIYKLDYLIERIEKNKSNYKPWVFDSFIRINDIFFGVLTESACDPRIFKFQCRLPHALGYAYGTSGDKAERSRVDNDFLNNLRYKTKLSYWRSAALYAGLRAGGAEKFGHEFSWAFASINK